MRPALPPDDRHRCLPRTRAWCQGGRGGQGPAARVCRQAHRAPPGRPATVPQGHQGRAPRSRMRLTNRRGAHGRRGARHPKRSLSAQASMAASVRAACARPRSSQSSRSCSPATTPWTGTASSSSPFTNGPSECPVGPHPLPHLLDAGPVCTPRPAPNLDLTQRPSVLTPPIARSGARGRLFDEIILQESKLTATRNVMRWSVHGPSP